MLEQGSPPWGEFFIDHTVCEFFLYHALYVVSRLVVFLVHIDICHLTLHWDETIQCYNCFCLGWHKAFIKLEETWYLSNRSNLGTKVKLKELFYLNLAIIPKFIWPFVMNSSFDMSWKNAVSAIRDKIFLSLSTR